jgi:copper chaperone CopZ
MTPTESYRIPVKGMSCQHCVGRVRAALEKLEGVKVQAVSIGEASVAVDPARTGRNEILAALRFAGYSPE